MLHGIFTSFSILGAHSMVQQLAISPTVSRMYFGCHEDGGGTVDIISSGRHNTGLKMIQVKLKG